MPGSPSPPRSVAIDGRDVLDAAVGVAARCAGNAAAVDREGAAPVEEMGWLAGAGLLAAPLARALGGAGLGSEPGGSGALLRVLTALGEGNLSVARLYEGHANALLLVQRFGTAGQAARAAADALAGRLFAVWNTEGADGLRLVPREDGRVGLVGAKVFASGAGLVDRPLVTGALPDGGWQMALPDLRAQPAAVEPGSWRAGGMRATASGRVDLTGIVLDPDALVGAPGDYYRQPWFSAGAVRFAAAQLGGAVALVEAARDDLRRHGRTGDDAQRERLGRMAVGLEGARLLLGRAGELADRSAFGGAAEPEVDDRTMVAYANLVRTAVERVCLDAIEYAQRSVGVRALLEPHPIERVSRDLSLYLRQPAPDAAVRDVGEAASAAERPVRELWGGAA